MIGGRSTLRPGEANPSRGGSALAAAALCLLLSAGAAPAFAVDAVLTDDGTFRDHSGRKQSPGNAPSLQVRDGRSSAAVRFDLSMLPGAPSGADIAKATLKLWINKVEAPGTIAAVRVGDEWSESELRADSDPGQVEPVAEGIEIGSDRGRSFLVIDVTSAVRDWLDLAAENRGLAIVGTSERVRLSFDSKENVEGGHEPELQIVYTWGGVSGSPDSQFLLGPPGPPGPPGATGIDGPVGPAGTALNPMRIARRRTYMALGTGYSAGSGPGPAGIVFDGVNFWVANRDGSTISRHRLVDGAITANVVVGNAPADIVYDGTNLWVANSADATVKKVRLSDQFVLGTYVVGTTPTALHFDGSSVWVVNSGSSSVTRLQASDGALLGSYAVGSAPAGICGDGNSVWITNSGAGTITRLAVADGQLLGTHAAGASPHGIVFDGKSLWVSDTASATVIRLSVADGSPTGTFGVGSAPLGLAFDGESIWVANSGSGSVSILRPSDGSLLLTREVGSFPEAIVFDGAHLWVTNNVSDTVSKL